MNILFLICPTDFLEAAIESNFNGNNYFYTSLGNSIKLEDKKTMEQIENFIKEKYISKVVFVLKENNTIISDIMNDYEYGNLLVASNLNKEINHHKFMMSSYNNKSILQKLCTSGHLNSKVILMLNILEPKFPNIEIGALLHTETHPYFIDVIHPLVTTVYLALN